MSTVAIEQPEAKREDGALVRAGSLMSRDSGVMALAMMDERDFELRLEALKKGQERVRRIQKELMIGPTADSPEGEDYGVIPGTKKPTLLKPGAEKICNVYGLVPTFQETWIEGDGSTAPHLRVRMKCSLHRGDANGPVVGEGVGAANSWEKKHRYRAAGRVCPECGSEGAIKRSQYEKNGDKGWYCNAKAGGCGANFRSDAAEIADQNPGRVENPDPFEVENTLLKMAKKRAHVDAVLTATATSGLFTQDVEDMDHDTRKDGNGKAPVGRPQRSAPREPGDDDEPVELPDGRVVTPGSGEFAQDAEAVENPNYTPAPTPQRRRTAGGPRVDPCPECKSARGVIVSKYPKNGIYFCRACQRPFGGQPEGA